MQTLANALLSLAVVLGPSHHKPIRSLYASLIRGGQPPEMVACPRSSTVSVPRQGKVTMPGLIGAVQKNSGQDVQSVFTAMLAPLQRGGRLRYETCIAPDKQWALGRVHLGVLQATPQLQGMELVFNSAN